MNDQNQLYADGLYILDGGQLNFLILIHVTAQSQGHVMPEECVS